MVGPSMSYITSQVTWSLILLALLSIGGCTAPNYLSVPPEVPATEQYRWLSPGFPTQAIVRDQHLGQLHAQMRHLEEALLRAEHDRLQACRDPEATQVNSVAYQRCQLKDQIYEQLKAEAAVARDHYLRAVSGRGGISR